MHWKYVPVLKITAHHEKYPPRSAADPLPNVSAFSIEPSQATRERFRRLGWLWKQEDGALRIFAEKTMVEGSAVIAKQPLEKEGFTFYIRAANAALLSETRPFNAAMSDTWGRPRLLCFDSLAAVAQADGTLALANPAEASHIGSRLPTPCQFEPASASISQLQLLSLSPSASAKIISKNSKSRLFDLAEAEGNYRMTQQSHEQTIYFSQQPPPSNAIGIIRIFGGSGNAWEPMRHFRLFFAR